MPNSEEKYKEWKAIHGQRKSFADQVEELDKPQEIELYTMGLDYICEHIYPFGTYKEETFGEYIDQYLKPREVQWAEIY